MASYPDNWTEYIEVIYLWNSGGAQFELTAFLFVLQTNFKAALSVFKERS